MFDILFKSKPFVPYCSAPRLPVVCTGISPPKPAFYRIPPTRCRYVLSPQMIFGTGRSSLQQLKEKKLHRTENALQLQSTAFTTPLQDGTCTAVWRRKHRK